MPKPVWSKEMPDKNKNKTKESSIWIGGSLVFFVLYIIKNSITYGNGFFLFEQIKQYI